MKIDQLLTQRFTELVDKGTTALNGRESNYKKFTEWSTSTLSLLNHVFGNDSDHYINFREQYELFQKTQNSYYRQNCMGVLDAAKEDYECGYLFNIRSLVKAEVLVDDVLEQATTLLHANYKDAACILAGVALESTLKELCIRQGIAINKMDRMNTELCKAEIYNMAKQKQITAWAELRNNAAHGDFNEYIPSDVDSFIKGVTTFMADYL